jgi:hypothetical protein
MAQQPWFVMRSKLDGGGSAGSSPDIMVGGPAADPKFATDYAKAFNQTGKVGGTNYVYVRAKNAAAELAIGNVSVYATHADGLARQSGWTPLQTQDARPITNIHADAGGIGVNGAALIWEPAQAAPADAPWCLVAVITGDGHPGVQVPSKVTDQATFDTWAAGEPRIAYAAVKTRDVQPVDGPTLSWEGMVDLGNDAEAMLGATLTCTSGTDGAMIGFTFDQKDSSGTAIGTQGPCKADAGYPQHRTVPANFRSKVRVFFTPKADGAAQAALVFRLSTETDDSNGDELGTSTETVVATYSLSFGQAKS